MRGCQVPDLTFEVRRGIDHPTLGLPRFPFALLRVSAHPSRVPIPGTAASGSGGKRRFFAFGSE